jgi:DNA-binding MarR family transcriptional regulator
MADTAHEESRNDSVRRDAAKLLLETVPVIMGLVSCEIRRRTPVESPAHFLLLRRLREGDASLHELAEAHSVRLPTMSRTVSVLERRGWVERTRAAGDRRTVLAHITDTGRAVLKDAEAVAVGRAAAILRDLDEDEMKQLSDGLRPLYRLIYEEAGRFAGKAGGEEPACDQGVAPGRSE